LPASRAIQTIRRTIEADLPALDSVFRAVQKTESISGYTLF
jgi:hypothetical protein